MVFGAFQTSMNWGMRYCDGCADRRQETIVTAQTPNESFECWTCHSDEVDLGQKCSRRIVQAAVLMRLIEGLRGFALRGGVG